MCLSGHDQKIYLTSFMSPITREKWMSVGSVNNALDAYPYWSCMVPLGALKRFSPLSSFGSRWSCTFLGNKICDFIRLQKEIQNMKDKIT